MLVRFTSFDVLVLYIIEFYIYSIITRLYEACSFFIFVWMDIRIITKKKRFESIFVWPSQVYSILSVFVLKLTSSFLN